MIVAFMNKKLNYQFSKSRWCPELFPIVVRAITRSLGDAA
jgi:hypothetical protein